MTIVPLEEVARETAVADDAVDGERPTDAEPGLNARFWEISFAERSDQNLQDLMAGRQAGGLHVEMKR